MKTKKKSGKNLRKSEKYQGKNQEISLDKKTGEPDVDILIYLFQSFGAPSPLVSEWHRGFGYTDSGKTLTFKAGVKGYDVQEFSTIIDIECKYRMIKISYIHSSKL